MSARKEKAVLAAVWHAVIDRDPHLSDCQQHVRYCPSDERREALATISCEYAFEPGKLDYLMQGFEMLFGFRPHVKQGHEEITDTNLGKVIVPFTRFEFLPSEMATLEQSEVTQQAALEMKRGFAHRAVAADLKIKPGDGISLN